MKVPGVTETWDMIMERALEKKVMLLPGRAFCADKSKPCSYLRAAFSLADEDKMYEAFRRLAELIREEKERKK